MSAGPDYAKIADQVFTLLNQLRREPNLFVAELTAMKKHYNGNAYRNPSLDYNVWTEEGVAAVDDAIAFVKAVQPVQPLERDSGLNAAVQRLIDYNGPTGSTTHGELDCAFEKRLGLVNADSSYIAENISFGWDNPREIVLQLVIDDGEAQRDNRRNIFSPRFTAVGTAAGPHKVYAHFCALAFFGRKPLSALSFSRYEIDRGDWPANAVSLQKHLERVTRNGQRIARLTYEFTLANGDKVLKEREVCERAEEADSPLGA